MNLNHRGMVSQDTKFTDTSGNIYFSDVMELWRWLGDVRPGLQECFLDYLKRTRKESKTKLEKRFADKYKIERTSGVTEY